MFFCSSCNEKTNSSRNPFFFAEGTRQQTATFWEFAEYKLKSIKTSTKDILYKIFALGNEISDKLIFHLIYQSTFAKPLQLFMSFEFSQIIELSPIQ